MDNTIWNLVPGEVVVQALWQRGLTLKEGNSVEAEDCTLLLQGGRYYMMPKPKKTGGGEE
jgi:hypothetical protein